MSNALQLSFGFTKRAFTVAVVVTTILWSVAASFAIAPRAAHAAASVAAGDLVKGSLPAVYYVGSDGKRYVFTNDKAYSTWYANFSSVKTISDTDLASIMIGGNVTYRPGVKMVKIQSDPKVYAVAHGGVLRWVSTEAAAVALFGSDWNKKIDDIADAFFVNYTVGTQISSASDYNVANEQTLSPTINADKGLTGSGAINISLASDNTAGGTVTRNAQGVSLLKFNVSGTGTVTGLTFTRQGAGKSTDFSNIYLYDGATRLTTGRSISSSTNQVAFSNLNVAVSGTKELALVGDLAGDPTAVVGNANSFALVAATDVVAGTTVGGTFPVSGNTFTISGSTGGSLTVSNGSSVSNPKVGQTGVELASFKVQATGGEDISIRRIMLTNSGSAQLSNFPNLKITDAGTVVAQSPTVSGSSATFTFAVPYVLAKGLQRVFSVVGDVSGANRAGVDTLHLYVDQTYDVYATGNTYGYGVGVTNNFTSALSNGGTAVSIQGGQVTFAFNGPTTGDISVGANDAILEKFSITSANHVEIRNLPFTLTASSDLTATTGGSSIPSITDIKVKNLDTGAVVTNQYDLSAWTDAGSNGTTTFKKAFTDRFEIAAGQTLNLALTADILSTAPSGLAGKSLTAQLNARTAGDVRNLDSNLDVATTDIVPSSALPGNAQTIRASGLTVGIAASPTSKTVTKGSTVSALGINFTAGSASDVKVSQIKLRAAISVDGTTTFGSTSTDSLGAAHPVQDLIQSVSIFDGSTQLGDAKSPDSSGDVTFSNLSWNVPAGTTKTITVKATLSNNLPYGASANKFLVDMIGDGGASTNSTANVTAQDKDSNIVTATNATASGWSDTDFHLQAGGTVTSAGSIASNGSTVVVTGVASGTVQIQLDGDTPVAAIVTANTSDNSMTRVKFTSVNEAFNVTRMTVANIGSGSSAITSVRVFDKNGTLFCSGALDSSGRLRCANDAGLFTVDGNTSITIKANIDQTGSGAGAVSGDSPKMALYARTADAVSDDIKMIGASSGTALQDASILTSAITITTTSTADGGATRYVEGNAMVVRKTQPTVATVASSTTLVNGQNTIYKFSVTAASNSDVALRQFKLAVSPTGCDADTVQVYENGSLLDASLYTAVNAASADVTGATNIDTAVTIAFTTERTVAAGTTKTYEVKATVSSAGAGDSISSYMLSDVVPDVDATDAIDVILTNASHNFVWSDTSAAVHAATAAGTAVSGTSTDWTTGYLVKTLPTTPQTLSL